MKRSLAVIAIALGSVWNAWAAAPATLTNLQTIHALTNAEASRAIPVAFEGTVTYYCWYTRELFVQDGDAAIFIFLTKDMRLAPGDRILARGVTRPSFHPIIESGDVTVLRHDPLPTPRGASYDDLPHAQLDGRVVTIRAAVRAGDIIVSRKMRSIYLRMLADGRPIDASVESDDASALKDLLDAEVEVTGVVAGKFDSKMQQTGIMIHASRLADIKVLKRAGASPWTLPVTPMNEILRGYRMRDLTQRLRIHETITYYQPGAAVVLQDGARSLWGATQTSILLVVGDVADAIGFPDVHDGFLNLIRGEIKDNHVRAPVAPLPADWPSLTLSNNIRLGHVYDLVSIEGVVVTETREAAQDEYVLTSHGHLFSAIYRHSDKASPIPLPPMKRIPLGSKGAGHRHLPADELKSIQWRNTF